MPSTLLTMFEYDAECANNFRDGNSYIYRGKDAALQHEYAYPLTDELKLRLQDVFVGDQSNPADLAQVEGNGPFDIIVDDGGHSMLQQITSLRELMRHVKPGGVYILEDLLTTYFWFDGPWHDEQLTGGITTMQYIYALIDALNWPPSVKTLPAPYAGIAELAQMVRSVNCFSELCVFTRK
jgi:hypothetical protein